MYYCVLEWLSLYFTGLNPKLVIFVTDGISFFQLPFLFSQKHRHFMYITRGVSWGGGFGGLGPPGSPKGRQKERKKGKGKKERGEKRGKEGKKEGARKKKERKKVKSI